MQNTGATKVKGSKKSRRMFGSVRAKAGLPAKAGNRRPSHIFAVKDRFGVKQYEQTKPDVVKSHHATHGCGDTGDHGSKDVRRFKTRKRSYEVTTPTGGYIDCRGKNAQHVPQDQGTVQHNCSHLVITGEQPELYDMVRAVVNET